MGMLIDARRLAFKKPNLNFKQVRQSLIKDFELFLGLAPLYSILFLSGCQTRLALNDELDSAIQFFGCHVCFP